MSKGDRVPEVMTTDWNLSNTGRIAMEASRHLKCITGFITFGVLSSDGSIWKKKDNIKIKSEVILNLALADFLIK